MNPAIARYILVGGASLLLALPPMVAMNIWKKHYDRRWFLLAYIAFSLGDVMTTLAGMRFTGLTFAEYELNPLATRWIGANLLFRLLVMPVGYWCLPRRLLGTDLDAGGLALANSCVLFVAPLVWNVLPLALSLAAP